MIVGMTFSIPRENPILAGQENTSRDNQHGNQDCGKTAQDSRPRQGGENYVITKKSRAGHDYQPQQTPRPTKGNVCMAEVGYPQGNQKTRQVRDIFIQPRDQPDGQTGHEDMGGRGDTANQCEFPALAPDFRHAPIRHSPLSVCDSIT